MAKTEYTHIRVSKELHEALKREAEASGVSIASYIANLHSSVQSMRTLLSNYGDVNMIASSVSPSTNSLSPGRDLDPRSPPYQGGALPTMLPRLLLSLL
jgi:hypothetical protein